MDGQAATTNSPAAAPAAGAGPAPSTPSSPAAATNATGPAATSAAGPATTTVTGVTPPTTAPTTAPAPTTEPAKPASGPTIDWQAKYDGLASEVAELRKAADSARAESVAVKQDLRATLLEGAGIVDKDLMALAPPIDKADPTTAEGRAELRKWVESKPQYFRRAGALPDPVAAYKPPESLKINKLYGDVQGLVRAISETIGGNYGRENR